MIDGIKKLFRDALTEPDGVTYCPVRVGASMVGALYHLAAGVGMLTGSLHFDMATLGQYMQHMMELIGFGGLTAGAKSAMRGDAANNSQ